MSREVAWAMRVADRLTSHRALLATDASLLRDQALEAEKSLASGVNAWRHERAVAALVWIACVSYAAVHLRHGWVPHDAGALSQSAQRVLDGQLPHRDFDDIYTGGLSYLNAAAFRVFGTSLLAMRMALLVTFAVWLLTVYAIARRVSTVPLALAMMMLAAAWSIPVYPEAMPSSYNLFFATFGVMAMFRYLDTERRRWLFIAGICAALSCLIKITGLYFVAAGLFFIAYREQNASRPRADNVPHGRIGSVVLTILIVLFNGALLVLVRRALGPDVVAQFVLPSASLSCLLAWREWRAPAASWRPRLASAGRLLLPFVAGLLLPIAIWLVPYIVSHSLRALAYGVFVLPTRRVRFTLVKPVGWMGFAVLVAEGAIMMRVARDASAHTRLVAEIATVVGFMVAPIAATIGAVYLIAWFPLRVLVPLAAVFATWYLTRRERQRGGSVTEERIFLLASTAAMCGLIQFPYATPLYFFYVGPLAALAVIALAGRGTPRLRRCAVAGALSYALFAALRIHPPTGHSAGLMFTADQQHALLSLERGGVKVTPSDSAMYESLVRALRDHSRSAYTYASPDCPQVYFLSGLRNPTRTLFDFFDDHLGRTPRILKELAAHDVTAIAINDQPEFSGPMPADLEAALDTRYPFAEQIGTFTVRWRQ